MGGRDDRLATALNVVELSGSTGSRGSFSNSEVSPPPMNVRPLHVGTIAWAALSVNACMKPSSSAARTS